MYYHFPVQGAIQKLNDATAQALMNQISSQWEDEATPFGRLYKGVHDWAYTKESNTITVNSPNLRTGGVIPNNQTAAATLGGDNIYGDCFIKPRNANDITQLDTLINGSGTALVDNQQNNL